MSVVNGNLFSPWHTRMIVLLTHEPFSDHAINKLSALGQIDDILAWGSNDAPIQVQTYFLITFRYLADAQRVLLPRSDAITRLVADQCDALPCPPELGIIRHHPLPCPDAVDPPVAADGTTRSVIFYNSQGREVRLTPRFQQAVEAAWHRVRASMAVQQNTPLEQTLLARCVPEPWRGHRWLIFNGFDTRRGRSTFESVEVAKRVVRKMKKEKWGGEWDVTEGRFVSDPVEQEDEEDERLQALHGDGARCGDIQVIREYGVSMGVWP
ncbi:hypothetical protein DFH27DRAFT_578724 [Peziza echinospora]|nr:hypothetical protein DFH27DRAFT_578724 [Peziza echinospora]